MADQDQKTEQPTPRRLQKAREDGNFPSARVFVNALQFLAFVALLDAWGPAWIRSIRESLAALLEQALDPRMTAGEILRLSRQLMVSSLAPVAALGGTLVTLTIAIQLGVTRFGVSGKKLAPDINRLNPLSRLKEMPKQNLPAVLQAMLLIPVFGAAVYYVVKERFETYLTLPLWSVPAAAAQVADSLTTLLWRAAGLFLVFGAVDLLRQQRRYTQGLKMSKQDIRDEMKEVEGNPLMKGRIARIRRDVARRRMMQEVPTATAVIVNPTHYAVALKYSMDAPGAPKVVAKGKNYLALRIRQRATDHGVPLIENPPLAQALYKSVDVGQEIPAQFYKAVAEVLAYIFRLMNTTRRA